MAGALKIEVEGPSGSHTVDENFVMQKLGQFGEQVVGKSPDGTKIMMADSQGQFEVPISDIVARMGFQVKNMLPSAPNESGVDFATRFAISELGDDDMKKAYIETKLRRSGIAEPQVMGRGRDWFTFDPDRMEWKALTNKSSWDLSDVAEALPAAAKGIASAAGGTLGGMMGAPAGGVGSIPGMMAGAAAGNALADAGMRGALYGLDPDYKEVSTLGQHLKEVGLESGVAGGTAGALGGAAKFLGPAVRKLVTSGPLSSLARGVGVAGKATSSGVQKVAGTLGGGPIRQDLTASMVPGMLEPQLAGMAAEIPALAIGKGIPGIGRAAMSKPGQAVLGENVAQDVARGVEGLSAKRAADPMVEWNNMMRTGRLAEDMPPTARDVSGNIGEKMAGWFKKNPATAGRAAEESQLAANQSAADALKFMNPEYASAVDAWQASGEPQEFAMMLANRASRAVIEENKRRAAQFGRYGETVGQGLENLASVGRGLTGAIRGATKGGLKATEAGAGASKLGFSGLEKAGILAQPYENYWWLNAGLQPLAEEQLSKRFPWKKPSATGTLLANE